MKRKADDSATTPGDGSGADQQQTQSGLVCFTIMPSGLHEEYQGGPEESEFVFSHVIERGLAEGSARIGAEIRSDREVDRRLSGSITKRLIQSLASADFVIADLTGGNPNVFLELGIRYALCAARTILLRQEGSEIPFDISNFKAISYRRFCPEEAVAEIAEFIENSYENPDVDSPVFDAIDDLKVHGRGVRTPLRDPPTEPLSMTFEEIMDRLQSLDFYDEAFMSGRFAPDAVVGITNGGLIMAEILSRKFFHRVPIIALWADRWSAAGLKDPKNHFFTNGYARAAIQPLKALKKERGDSGQIKVLVVDDNVSSGTSCKYAVQFLRDELGKDTEIVFQPIVCKITDYLSAVDDVLPHSYSNNIFGLDRDKFLEQLITKKSRFPYDKDIRG